MLCLWKNHQLPPGNKNQDVSVRSCLLCSKWCYITKKCNADKSIKHCHECKFKIDTNEVISNESPIHSAISPITNQCDSSKQVRIHKALTQLLKGLIQDTELTLLDYKDLLTLRLTHLHPTEHNIFSMNHPTNDPVNGLFLSAKSVMLLAEPESKFMVTEEMINFFVDCFNFYGESFPEGLEEFASQNDYTLKPPEVIFCKPNDDVAKINVLYNKKNNFTHIVNAIPTCLTDDDENEIKNEIKIWYLSNYNTFLDSVITKYNDAKSTTFNQICVPIKGNHWSIIDVKVNPFDIIKQEGEVGFVQQIIFQDVKKMILLPIWMQLRIELHSLQFGGLNILVCTLVRIW